MKNLTETSKQYYHLYVVKPGIYEGVGTLELQVDEYGERWEYDCDMPMDVAEWLDTIIYDLIDGMLPENLPNIPDGWALSD